ncbi:unnamed protein product, partial [Vitis vinifera]
MDCNKEEALRAKVISEKKMQSGDFIGARRIAQRAQQLFPDLENISQLLTVCDVHCSAQNKIYGTEMDWYGILKVEQAADDAIIKKQYRKLALLLHPDKNKFAGAEAAFKLIGEANRILSDQGKRSAYDMKYRVSLKHTAPKPPPHQLNRNSFVRKQYGTQPVLRCQTCQKSFIAYDLGAQSVPPGATWSQPAFSLHNEVPNQCPIKVKTQSPAMNPGSMGSQGSFNNGNVDVGSKKGVRMPNEDAKEAAIAQEKGVVPSGENSEFNIGHQPRRSSRKKQHVYYNESVSDDDDFVSPPKKARMDGSLGTGEERKDKPLDDGVPKTCNTAAGGCMINGKAAATADDNDESLECLDCDFSDFDKDKREDCFSVDQIWAIYDPIDGMPRFYARIRKVFAPEFKLRFTWLEPSPDDASEIAWVKNELPYACGGIRNSYFVYPRKGETWAIYKNWNTDWSSNPEIHRKYEFEYVEILSDFVPDAGIGVAYLGKVKGFVSLFRQSVQHGIVLFQIPPSELLRFSHRIPSFRMTGSEGEGVPKGSFELDPAALPNNLNDFSAEIGDKNHGDLTQSKGSIYVNLADERINTPKKHEKDDLETGSISSCQYDEKIPLHVKGQSSNSFTKNAIVSASISSNKILEAQFYDFSGEKSEEKFQTGQLWALYSEVDRMPKNYAQVKKIEPTPSFRLHVVFLEACSPPKDMVQPVCCGTFKLKNGKTKVFPRADFSHQIRAESIGKNKFAILPIKGQVWALYKNWENNLMCSDIVNCKYDIVEVLEDNDHSTKVSVLLPLNDCWELDPASVPGILVCLD